MIANTHNSKNQELTEQYNKNIRKYSFTSNGYYLLRIDSSIIWDDLIYFIPESMYGIKELNIDKSVTIPILKCLILANIFDFTIEQIQPEIKNNHLFMKFLNVDCEEKVPKLKLIFSFYHYLAENNLYDFILEKFYSQLLEQSFEITDQADPQPSKALKENNIDKYDKENYDFIISDKVYAKMNELLMQTQNDTSANDSDNINNIDSDHLMEKLQHVHEFIQGLKKKLNIVEGKEKRIEEPIVLYPKFKTEGIFNDENLTEDYELGYRFHQLGLKMGFFNVKLDVNNESSRISTAEFFPNTFWGSVKQRSRWIAGICFQNWKEHKWKGNLTMKYFLFRDRKSLFSLPGAFLSNVIFVYLIYAIFINMLFDGNSVYLVSNSTVLWYLMAANVIFMISRASHRFIFTYNWYGFKYASNSFFRLIIDTAINFFAVLRSIDVFRKTRKKVVWDSTSHY